MNVTELKTWSAEALGYINRQPGKKVRGEYIGNPGCGMAFSVPHEVIDSLRDMGKLSPAESNALMTVQEPNRNVKIVNLAGDSVRGLCAIIDALGAEKGGK